MPGLVVADQALNGPDSFRGSVGGSPRLAAGPLGGMVEASGADPAA
jgi:hypothetical protein